jgi:hypothetical protein
MVHMRGSTMAGNGCLQTGPPQLLTCIRDALDLLGGPLGEEDVDQGLVGVQGGSLGKALTLLGVASIRKGVEGSEEDAIQLSNNQSSAGQNFPEAHWTPTASAAGKQAPA